MPLTPVEIRHLELKHSLFRLPEVSRHRMMDDIAESFESVWRERSQLAERVEELEMRYTRHVELEGLLRSTLLSAERAAQDLKEGARREADVIVTEANAEARKILRDAITEKEALMGDVRRIQIAPALCARGLVEGPLRDGSQQAPERPAHPAAAPRGAGAGASG